MVAMACHHGYGDLTWKGRLKGGFSLLRPSEAERRHETPALVLNDVRTFQALESGFGICVAKCRGLFVIGLCCRRVLRAASSTLGKCAHSFHCPGMVLRGGFFKERPRCGIVLRAADAIGGHQSKLILRLRGVCLRRFRQHGPGLDGIGRRATTGGKSSKIANASGITGFGCTLEQLARRRFILRDAGSGAKQHTEFDHRRRASLVGRFALSIACILGTGLVSSATVSFSANAQSADLVLCDRIAADPSDPDKPADVKGTAEIAPSDIPTAIKFCKTASASSRRALYELGRAYAANRQMPEAMGAWRHRIALS